MAKTDLLESAKEVIAIIESSKKTHEDWLAYFEKNPNSQLFEEYKNLGDMAHHKKCVEDYNKVIAYIRRCKAEPKLREALERMKGLFQLIYEDHTRPRKMRSNTSAKCQNAIAEIEQALAEKG